MDLLRKIFKHGMGTPWYIIKAILGLLFFKISLATYSFIDFKNKYNKHITSSADEDTPQDTFNLLTYCINAASTLLPSSCLQKALLLKYYLRKDKTYKIIIGIPQSSVSSLPFTAHAWIERNHIKVYGDIPNEKLTPLWEWN
jgi:hypothetical protein